MHANATPYMLAAAIMGVGLGAALTLTFRVEPETIDFVTLHPMAVLDLKGDEVTKGDADYKEGWSCAMVRPREATFVRSALSRDDYGNTMLACFWTEPLR